MTAETLDPAARRRADAEWAFDAYEAVRERLPSARFPSASQTIPDLGAAADSFDAVLLDAYGVLNVGETAIAGAAERIAALQAMGKRVMVVSNSAGYPKRHLMARYLRMGFNFAPEEVVSSREAALAGLAAQPPRRWGVMADPQFGSAELEHLGTAFLADDPAAYDAAEGILLIGSGTWTEARQALLEASLRARPRPVVVANPDIVAPREDGLSREPGHYAHRLADSCGVVPEFYGKPFGNIFELALARLPAEIPRDRILMVGDTLQTDILGGAAAGLRTALVTGHGALVGMDVGGAIARSGITPDFILPSL
ncbi:HAD-IIA family hydrolase [Acidimangrovimonas pyrenivorans]|uniref:HAD-IIA family hydrolase n=1 Tax=Acidimangrovimonas pyrenivorans TaxID=2030798 RepID=A0ABV7ADK5_9RHOB